MLWSDCIPSYVKKKKNVVNTGEEIMNPVFWSRRTCFPIHSSHWCCSGHSLDPGWGDCAAVAGWLVSSLAVFAEPLLIARRSRSSLFSIYVFKGQLIQTQNKHIFLHAGSLVVSSHAADSFGFISAGFGISVSGIPFPFHGQWNPIFGTYSTVKITKMKN